MTLPNEAAAFGTGRGPQSLPSRRPRTTRTAQRARSRRRSVTSWSRLTKAAACMPPRLEVRDQDRRRGQRADDARRAGDHLERPGHREQLAGEECERPQPQHDRDQHAHRAVEAPLEEIAHRQEAGARRRGGGSAARPRGPAPGSRSPPSPTTTTRRARGGRRDPSRPPSSPPRCSRPAASRTPSPPESERPGHEELARARHPARGPDARRRRARRRRRAAGRAVALTRAGY